MVELKELQKVAPWAGSLVWSLAVTKVASWASCSAVMMGYLSVDSMVVMSVRQMVGPKELQKAAWKAGSKDSHLVDSSVVLLAYDWVVMKGD